MNCWAILRLDPTSDTRAIKKAYAVLLKQNRPDENPSEFQVLHSAYKQALDWAQGQAEPALEPEPQLERMPEPAIDAPLLSTDPASVELPVAEPEPPYEEDAWETFLAEQWDILVDQIEQLLQQPEQRNRPQAWDFFTENEALLDIEFKSAFALRFLQHLIQVFKQQQEEGQLILMPDIVQHLNKIFWWSERRHHYESYFSHEELDDFFLWWQPRPQAAARPSPPAPTKPVPRRIAFGNYYMRWLALLVDLAPLILVAYGLNHLAHWDKQEEAFAVIAGVLSYFVLSTVFEASRLQATPGKWLCHLQVCDPGGSRLPLWRSLLRSVLFVVSVQFFYVTLIINMLIWDGRLLHDRLSRSIVLKRQTK